MLGHYTTGLWVLVCVVLWSFKDGGFPNKYSCVRLKLGVFNKNFGVVSGEKLVCVVCFCCYAYHSGYFLRRHQYMVFVAPQFLQV